MTSQETETHCVGTYSANTGSFKNPIIVLNELSVFSFVLVYIHIMEVQTEQDLKAQRTRAYGWMYGGITL